MEDVVPVVLKPGRTPIVFDVKEAQERRLVGESLSSVRERLRQVTKGFTFLSNSFGLFSISIFLGDT